MPLLSQDRSNPEEGSECDCGGFGCDEGEQDLSVLPDKEGIFKRDGHDIRRGSRPPPHFSSRHVQKWLEWFQMTPASIPDWLSIFSLAGSVELKPPIQAIVLQIELGLHFVYSFSVF